MGGTKSRGVIEADRGVVEADRGNQVLNGALQGRRGVTAALGLV